jgi:hypothetical protein
MTIMQIVMRKTSELMPYAHNPRDNAGAVDAVARSIREFGFRKGERGGWTQVLKSREKT